MKIVVLGGGVSTERHVSLVTATSVCKALRSRGHKAIFVDMYLGLETYEGPLDAVFDAPDGLCPDASIGMTEPDLAVLKASRKDRSPSRLGKDVLNVCAAADCVFLGLHGADGEDGKIQATLDLMGIPYTGSDHLGSAVAMDKAASKRVMDACGITTPLWQELHYTADDIPCLLHSLPLPCAVKIVNGGSSIGVQLPDTRAELAEALNATLAYGSRVIVEEKIIGRELTVPVLGDRALSPIEIVPPEGKTFDYVSKYQPGALAASEICPARVSEKEKAALCEVALRVHRALGLSVYSRIDLIMDKTGKIWCLEANSLPGMTPSSLIPKAAAVEGMSYEDLCEEIVRLSLLARSAEKR